MGHSACCQLAMSPMEKLGCPTVWNPVLDSFYESRKGLSVLVGASSHGAVSWCCAGGLCRGAVLGGSL